MTRNSEIYEMRKAGKTYTDIGKRFGISCSRARDIYRDEKWELGIDEKLRPLAKRYFRCLLRQNIETYDQLIQTMDHGGIYGRGFGPEGQETLAKVLGRPVKRENGRVVYR